MFAVAATVATLNDSFERSGARRLIVCKYMNTFTTCGASSRCRAGAPRQTFHKNGTGKLLQEARNVSSMADIHYIQQKKPMGQGDAVLMAERHVSDEPFAVLLGDGIIRGELCIKQLMDVYGVHKCSVRAVEAVDGVSKYEIVKCSKIDGPIYPVEDVVEKPNAPSKRGAIGSYILTPAIFSCIKEVEPKLGGRYN